MDDGWLRDYKVVVIIIIVTLIKKQQWRWNVGILTKKRRKSYQVVTKKKQACHVRALETVESGAQTSRAGGMGLLTATNM